MPKAGCCVVALLLLAAPAVRAQVPALLPDFWEGYEIGFVPDATVLPGAPPPSTDPQVANLNAAVLNREAHLLVEFRPDGTSEFIGIRDGRRIRAEVGTYTLENNELVVESTAPAGSSLSNQRLAKLTKHTLVLAFAVGSHLPGTQERVAYRQLRKIPLDQRAAESAGLLGSL